MVVVCDCWERIVGGCVDGIHDGEDTAEEQQGVSQDGADRRMEEKANRCNIIEPAGSGVSSGIIFCYRWQMQLVSAVVLYLAIM
mmetsp:Transcript_8382/g.18781  ORF Transcript_8382/g.18781 Transcript_8382/m.18781 type:complete len:84 (-) Transcript_8382:45-296(-)